MKPTESIGTQTDNDEKCSNVPQRSIPQIRVTSEDDLNQVELARNFRPSSSEFIVSTSLSAAIIGLAYNGLDQENNTEFLITNPETAVPEQPKEVFTPEVFGSVELSEAHEPDPTVQVPASSANETGQNSAVDVNRNELNLFLVLKPDTEDENVQDSSQTSQISSALVADENLLIMADNGSQMNDLSNVNENDHAFPMLQQTPELEVAEHSSPILQLKTLEVEENGQNFSSISQQFSPMQVVGNDPNSSEVVQQIIDPDVEENGLDSLPVVPLNSSPEVNENDKNSQPVSPLNISPEIDGNGINHSSIDQPNNLPEVEGNGQNSLPIQQLNEIPEPTEHDQAFSMLQQILAPEVDGNVPNSTDAQLNEILEDDEFNQTRARNSSEDFNDSIPDFNNIPQTSTPSRARVSSFHRGAIPVRSLNFEANPSLISLNIPDQNISAYQFPEPVLQSETINNTELPGTSADLGLSTLQDSLVQENSSISLAALREYTEADKYIKSPNDVLVTVNNQNFNKIYVVRKFRSQTEAKEFCREEVSRRSMLFKVSQNGQAGAMSVKKLPKIEMKHLCGPYHRSTVSSAGTKVDEVKISRENFTVQRLNEGKKNQLETLFPAVDIDVSKNHEDADQFNVTKF